MHGLEDAGADVIELGLPFSDPMADGPVIQASSQRALEQGMNFDRLLELVAPRERRRAARAVQLSQSRSSRPATTRSCAPREAGIRGLLLTDLPVGADPEREAWIGAGPLEFIRLVAPTTPLERMREIADARTADSSTSSAGSA